MPAAGRSLMTSPTMSLPQEPKLEGHYQCWLPVKPLIIRMKGLIDFKDLKDFQVDLYILSKKKLMSSKKPRMVVNLDLGRIDGLKVPGSKWMSSIWMPLVSYMSSYESVFERMVSHKGTWDEWRWTVWLDMDPQKLSCQGWVSTCLWQWYCESPSADL